MNRYSGLLLAEAGIVFLIIFVFLFLLYKRSPKEGFVQKRTGLYQSFSARTIVYIVLAAAAITYFVSQFSYSGLTTALVFVSLLGMMPLFISNERKRIKQEETFSEVILYCQNMGMLLKQSHNVYSSLRRASEDLTSTLGEDVRGLLESLEVGKDDALCSMDVLESNYPYSCIKNLDVIILHMFYENANVDDSLLTTYQDDVTALEQDVRKNKAKRKSLRISYIIITAGSVLAYWFFVRNLSETFESSFNNGLFRMLNMFYIFGTMLAFFFVDRYFNLNTTKE